MVSDTFWRGSQGTLALGDSSSKSYKCPMKDCDGELFIPKDTGGNNPQKIERDLVGHTQIVCSKGHYFIGTSLQRISEYKPKKSRRLFRR